tara:strand:- start:436 stop:1371 length:936 start_codon:yes stop_codon:yes gene_type:complete
MTESSSEDIKLSEIIKVLYQGRRTIIYVTSIFILISVGVSLYLKDQYKAEILVAPSGIQGSSQGNSSTLSGLAGLAGFSIGEFEGGTKVQEAMEIIKSRKFISEFINKHEIKPAVMAGKSLDKISGDIVIDESKYDTEKKVWKKDISMQKTIEKFLKDNLNFNEDKKTGFITISITTLSPTKSKEWVDSLLLDLNNFFRDQAISEATTSLNYLKNQLGKAQLIEVRQSIFNLIQDQIKIITLAEGREEYLFRTLDPSVVPDEKTSPARTLICIIGSFIGFLFSVTYLLISHFSGYKLKYNSPFSIKIIPQN